MECTVQFQCSVSNLSPDRKSDQPVRSFDVHTGPHNVLLSFGRCVRQPPPEPIRPLSVCMYRGLMCTLIKKNSSIGSILFIFERQGHALSLFTDVIWSMKIDGTPSWIGSGQLVLTVIKSYIICTESNLMSSHLVPTSRSHKYFF